MQKVIFEKTILTVCTLSIPSKGKAENTYYQHENEEGGSKSAIL